MKRTVDLFMYSCMQVIGRADVQGHTCGRKVAVREDCHLRSSWMLWPLRTMPWLLHAPDDDMSDDSSHQP